MPDHILIKLKMSTCDDNKESIVFDMVYANSLASILMEFLNNKYLVENIL